MLFEQQYGGDLMSKTTPPIGARPSLFPAYKDTQQEQRLVSMMLRICEIIPNVAEIISLSAGTSTSKRNLNSLSIVIEPIFKNAEKRPDAYIRIGDKSILVEKKTGTNEIKNEQIQHYGEIAFNNDIDVILTISNQLTSDPTHHPSDIKLKRRKIDLRHVSWRHIATGIDNILKANTLEADPSKRDVLKDFYQFLENPTVSGVLGFTQMSPEWTMLCQSAVGERLNKSVYEQCVKDWFQEEKELTLLLMREFKEGAHGTGVSIYQKRSETSEQRFAQSVKDLEKSTRLVTDLSIRGASSLMKVSVDIRSHKITISMNVSISGPSTIRGQVSKLKSMLSHLAKDDSQIRDHVKILAYKKYARERRSCTIDRLFNDEWHDQFDMLKSEDFNIEYDMEISKAHFRGRKIFITHLEKGVMNYYSEIGQWLRNDQKPAPKTKDA